MRKLEIADPEVMRIAIQQEIVRSDESRYDHRLHGLLLLTGGQSCQQVAELFGEDRRTVQRWVGRFETRGLEGLREGERPGRPAMLDAKQWVKLGRDLRSDPSKFGHTAHLWDGKLLSEHLREAAYANRLRASDAGEIRKYDGPMLHEGNASQAPPR